MTKDRIEVFCDANYLVFLHGPLVHPCTIIGFSWRRDADHPLVAGDFTRQFLPDHVANWGLNANFMSFLTSRNCWYLAPEVEEAIAAIKAVTAGSRIITYGSSMGGYAAVNLSNALNADYFFALSPMSTIFDPFMAEIKDFRFSQDRSLLSNTRDGIARGDHADRRGLIVYDDKHVHDAKHAEVILSQTRSEALTVSFSGHPSMNSLNRIYPLRDILAAIVDGSVDAQSLQAHINTVVPDLPETLAGAMQSFPRFLDIIDKRPDRLGPEAFQSAVTTLTKAENCHSITKAMIDKVAQAAVAANCWEFAHSTYIQTVWHLGLAYESLGLTEDAGAYAKANLPESILTAFIARR